MSLAEIVPSDRIEGIVRIVPQEFADARGSFRETWRTEWVPDAPAFVQHNLSRRQAGSVVGLHYHRYQADYWVLIEGSLMVGLADLRTDSRTFQIAEQFVMEPGQGVYIPKGIAHGFAALTDIAMTYAVDQYYNPEDELGVAWDDPTFAIDWGVEAPVLSDRDRAQPRFAELSPEMLPRTS